MKESFECVLQLEIFSSLVQVLEEKVTHTKKVLFWYKVKGLLSMSFIEYRGFAS